MRLDKWLWAARFYKTRPLAAEAIQGGKVHLNGQRTKPGRDVRIGSQLQISKGGLEWQIEVTVLPRQRRPAKEAIGFYLESEESQALRAKTQADIQAMRAAMPLQTDSKPTKKDRRLIHRFKRSTQ